ncbi:MAG: LolA family protein [Candidatus Binatia bacterium]
MRGRIIAWFGLFGLACGCASPVVSVFPSPQPPIAATIRSRDLLSRLESRYRAVRSFRALAEMQYRNPRERIHVREVILVDRPDRLRIEMISTFGVALQITSDGQRLRAYHRGERTFYSGEATAGNLARFTRLPLDIREIADLLVGLPPRRDRGGTLRTAFEEPTGLWRLTAPLADGGLQILWFDHERLLPVRTEEVTRDGERRYLTAYYDYREVDGIAVPHGIELDVPREDAVVSLRYSEVTLNVPAKQSLFSFEPPPGAKVVDLDRLS